METLPEAVPEPDSTPDPIAPDMTPPAPDVEQANVLSTFACVHPTISLRTATDKLNGAEPIIDVQTEIVVRYADGNVSRVSVAHTQHAAGPNTARIADALSQVTSDSAIRCLAN
ncbi:MAG: hypothetical protein V4796_04495 [Burkholderia cenocepacia]